MLTKYAVFSFVLAFMHLVVACGEDSGSDEAATSPGTDNNPTATGNENTPTASGYVQTGKLGIVPVTGGADVDLRPAGLTNDELGDLGFASTAASGKLTIGAPSMVSSLALPSASASLHLTSSNAIDTTVIPNQCTGSTAGFPRVKRFACDWLQVESTTEPNIFDDIERADARIQTLISDLEGTEGRKPLCLLTEDDEYVSMTTKLPTSVRSLFFDNYLACVENNGTAPEDNERVMMIGLGKRGDDWYLMEHQDNFKYISAKLSANGDFHVIDAGTSSTYTRGEIRQVKRYQSTGFIEISSGGISQGNISECGSRVIFGKISGVDYIYQQSHMNDNGTVVGSNHKDDDTCADVTGSLVYEGCAKVSSLGTVEDLSSAPCTTLKNALTLPKHKPLAAWTDYSPIVSLRADGHLNHLINWRLDDAIVAIKYRMFKVAGAGSNSTDKSQYEKWLEQATDVLQAKENLLKAPCMRGESKEFSVNSPFDLGFQYYLNCEAFESSKSMYGHRNNIWYTWNLNASTGSESGANRGFFAKVEEKSLEAWFGRYTNDGVQESNQDYGLTHFVANADTKRIEFSMAGSGLFFGMGCGTQFNIAEDYIYGKGKFSSDNCDSVPEQDICVDSTNIKRVASSFCTDRKLNIFSLRKMLPGTEFSSSEDALTINPTQVSQYFTTRPAGLEAPGDPGDWGAYNSAAPPVYNDPQYGQPFTRTNDFGASGGFSCRDSTASSLSLPIDYTTTLDFATASTASLDALSVAAPAEVARVLFSGIYDVNLRPGAIYDDNGPTGAFEQNVGVTLSATVELMLDDNGSQSSLGTVTIEAAEKEYKFDKLLTSLNTIASFTGKKLLLKYNGSLQFTCPTGVQNSEAWAAIRFNGGRLVY